MDLSAPLFYEGEFPIGTAGSLKPGCAVAKRQLEQAMAAQVEASDCTAAPHNHTLTRALRCGGAGQGPALLLY
jgi:hypothetical protein